VSLQLRSHWRKGCCCRGGSCRHCHTGCRRPALGSRGKRYALAAHPSVSPCFSCIEPCVVQPCAPPWHAAVSAPVRRPAPRCFSLVRRLLTTVILCSLLNGASPLPSVTNFSPMNVQISSTTTITFIGEQFGGADFSPSAYAAGQLCTTTSWTKATSLLCVAGVSYLSSGTDHSCHLAAIVTIFHLIATSQVLVARHGSRLLEIQ
jgi:hypothetical protein